MPPHPLTNYQNEHRSNGVYSRDNLRERGFTEIKDGAILMSTLILEIAVGLYVQNNNVTYFHSFGVEHIPKEIEPFIGNKNIKTNIFRMQAYDSIMCGYFCIGFIDFMIAGKTLTEFTNIFIPNNFKIKNDITLKYFIINV